MVCITFILDFWPTTSLPLNQKCIYLTCHSRLILTGQLGGGLQGIGGGASLAKGKRVSRFGLSVSLSDNCQVRMRAHAIAPPLSVQSFFLYYVLVLQLLGLVLARKKTLEEKYIPISCGINIIKHVTVGVERKRGLQTEMKATKTNKYSVLIKV